MGDKATDVRLSGRKGLERAVRWMRHWTRNPGLLVTVTECAIGDIIWNVVGTQDSGDWPRMEGTG